MIYLKKFNNESDYLVYRDNKKKYLKPNVSFSIDSKAVHYNYPPTIIYEYVDLGLPSGTKWATQNVGATKPSEYGQYFQWGDTIGYTANEIGTGEGQKKFAKDWSDYKWYSGSTFTKYTKPGATLELEDDAAHANMGGNWHTPTPAQYIELLGNTTRKWTTLDGVSGMTLTSKKDTSKSIFFPAAGSAENGTTINVGPKCATWTSVLNTSNIRCSQYLYFERGEASIHTTSIRCQGFVVRGVIDH